MAYEKNVSVLQNNNLSLSGSVVTVTGSLYGSFMSGTVSEFTEVNAQYLDLAYDGEPTHETGRVYYDTSSDIFAYDTEIDGTNIRPGRQLAVRVKNVTGGTLNKGKIVRIVSASNNSDTPNVSTASYDSEYTSADTLAMMMNNTDANDNGYALLYGVITGINTNGYSVGDMLYLSSSGDFTTTVPQSPLHEVRVGQVVRSANNGTIYVKIQNGYETDELHDVLFSSKAEGDLISWDATTGVWRNKKQLTGSYEITGDITASSGQFTNITADTITAREYHTELVSASIIYQSGSTKFGDTSDDTHQFTGSVLVNGSVTVDTLKSSTATISLYTASPSDTINIGRASLGTSINLKSNDVVVEKDLAVNGGDLTSTSTTFNLLNSGVSTINFGGGASSMYIGSAASTMAIGHASGTGTTNIRNALTTNGNVTLGNDASDTTTVNGPLAANGGSMSTNDGTFNLLTTTATTINFGSAAVSMNIGSSTGTTNINNRLVVDGSAAGDSTIAGNLAVDTSTLYVDSSSNEVGIGTTSPNAKLDVNGNAVVSGSLTVTGTVTELSTKRIKKNIRSMKSQLDTISKLNPVTYYRRDTEEKTKEYGFISEEVKEVYPEFVKNEGVNYSKMVSVLVSAVKELKDKVEEQQKEIEELKKGSSSNKIVTLGS